MLPNDKLNDKFRSLKEIYEEDEEEVSLKKNVEISDMKKITRDKEIVNESLVVMEKDVKRITRVLKLGMSRRNNVLKDEWHFAAVLYKVVDRKSTDSIISWSENGNSFIIWDVDAFCKDVIIRYFGLTKFPFFAYKLKTFEFDEVESGRLEYANELFVRGKPELTAEMARRNKDRFKTKPKGPLPSTLFNLVEPFLMTKREKAEAAAKEKAKEMEKEMDMDMDTEKEMDMDMEKEKEKEKEKEALANHLTNLTM
ncbi:unnamed protein product [Cochlearia groenlandica]